MSPLYRSRSRPRKRGLRLHGGLWFVAVLTVVALPAGAEAKPGYKVQHAGLKLVLLVAKTDRSSISLSADGRQRVWFVIERPTSTIEYSTKGRVSGQHIAADFGALGRIDVKLRFAQSETSPAHSGRCKGRGTSYGNGTYHGMIELSGERGVPNFSVRRGQALFERRFRQVCKRRSPQPDPNLFPKLRRRLEEGVLTVLGKGEGRTIRFWANVFAFRRNPAHSGGTVGASVYERDEGVRITRRTGRFFFDKSIIMSKRNRERETIEVAPPQPFTGHALYSRSSGGPARWTGELKIDLPGVDGIRLTGPGFSPVLCRGAVGSCLNGSGSTSSGALRLWQRP
jgi:hypothetical protein